MNDGPFQVSAGENGLVVCAKCGHDQFTEPVIMLSVTGQIDGPQTSTSSCKCYKCGHKIAIQAVLG